MGAFFNVPRNIKKPGFSHFAVYRGSSLRFTSGPLLRPSRRHPGATILCAFEVRMITIDFSQRNKLGLCEFLIESIKNQILNGILTSDEKLPSKRSLAQHLGISVITVQNAYGQLISEGYIYSLEKKGFYVTNISFLGRQQNPQKKSPQTHILQNEEPSHSTTQKQNHLVADFSNNSTNGKKFPFTLWAKTMRSVLNRQDQTLLERIDTMGVPALRKAICNYLRDFRNMNVDPEQLVIGAGTEYLFSIIVQLFGQNQVFAVENPGYHKIASIINLNGAKCIPTPIDDQGIIIKQLDQNKAQVVHVSPAHHFPTGIVMPIRRRMELLEWASQSSDRYIIEDDYDSEFRFNGKPLQTLLSSGSNKDNKVIFVNTFSKTLSPSFRISYMILPMQLVPVFKQKIGFYSCPVSAFEQWTLAEFIQSGSYEKHINRMKNFYRSIRNELITSLQNCKLSSLIKIHEQEAGLHFLMTINNELSGDQIKQQLLEHGIKINLLSDYFYGQTTQSNTFIVNYSGIQKENISSIIQAMEDALLKPHANSV